MVSVLMQVRLVISRSPVRLRQSAPFIPKGRNETLTAMLRFFFVYNLSKYQLVYLKLALIEISNSFKFSSSIPAVGTIHSLMRRNQASTAMLRLFYLPVPPRPVNGQGIQKNQQLLPIEIIISPTSSNLQNISLN